MAVLGINKDSRAFKVLRLKICSCSTLPVYDLYSVDYVVGEPVASLARNDGLNGWR